MFKKKNNGNSCSKQKKQEKSILTNSELTNIANNVSRFNDNMTCLKIRGNVISKDDCRKEIGDTLQFLSNTIAKTVGPYGSTTIIQDRELRHTMSKDGYTVLKNLFFKKELPSTVLDIVKRISRTLVTTVGDGSSSSVIISNSLFKSIIEISDELKISPQLIIDILKSSASVIEEMIKEEAVYINDEEIKERIRDIAAVSLNNDTKTGELFAEIFSQIGKYGFVNLKLSKSDKDYYESASGIEVYRGYIDYLMANQDDKETAIYKNAKVFMCNSTLDEEDMDMLADMMGKICIQKNIPLIIVAKDYSRSIRGFLNANLQKNKTLPLVAIDMACESKIARDKFEDLAMVLGCEFYDKAFGDLDFKWSEDKLGSCKEFICDDKNTRFIEGVNRDSEEVLKRVKVLEEELERLTKINDHIDRDGDIHDLRRRICSLNSVMINLYVGGNSEAEKETRQYLFEDAIFACKSALNYGYVLGGNLTIPTIIHFRRNEIISYVEKDLSHLTNILGQQKTSELLNTILIKISEAFTKSFKTVLSNVYDDEIHNDKIINYCIVEEKMYNIKTATYDTIETSPIINSAQTEIEIMKACFSIISLLATSNQFVSINEIIPNK